MNEVLEKIVNRIDWRIEHHKKIAKAMEGAGKTRSAELVVEKIMGFESAKTIIMEAAEEYVQDKNAGNNGKWNKNYKGNARVINTGEMISVYECTCSVCGWKTGNQGMRFNYCLNCGAKMDEPHQPKGE